MCTVTFWPRKTGYALAMNRDEKLTRVPGLPPELKHADGRSVLCPSEPGGGTWISLNDSGACLALINWYSVATQVKGKAVSRGVVINAVSGAGTRDGVDATLPTLPLNNLNPFCLIGVFPVTGEIAEWRWDL